MEQQTWDVKINGTTVGSFAPPSSATSYVDYSVTFAATGTSQTLAFVGSNLNGGDNTAFFDNVRIQIAPNAPSVPTGLSATAGAGQATLNWTAAASAANYNVKRSTTSGSGYVTITNVTATGFTDTNLTGGTTYYYVVSAVNLIGESVNSSQVSVVPASPVPPLIAVTISGSELRLSWPVDHMGWTLQVQTNSLSTGLRTNWVNVPNSSSVSSVTNAINPGNGSVFYRLVSP